MPLEPLLSRISQISARRQPSAIREIISYLSQQPPGSILSFAGGMPNTNLFPFASATFQLKDGSEIKITPEMMNETLQYGPSTGYPPLVTTLIEFQKKLHSTPNNILSREGKWGVMPIGGSMDGISKALDMFLNEGDSYLVEVPAYSGILAAMGPHNGKPICCEVDSNGLVPDQIRCKIESALKKGWTKPKFLYTCATATNPTGATTSPERREKIYSLACEYDFYIIEDDPYYFVRFDIENPIPSYLSLDTEGRVLRMDSFSKVLSAGIRLGFVTASNELIHRLMLHMQTTTMHPSNLPQVLVAQLLKQWGFEKFIKHTQTVSAFYKKQMEAMVEATEKHLKGLVEYSLPTGGMFLWMRIPSIRDTKSLIMQRAASKKIMFVPGSAFFPDFADADQLSNDGHRQYIRASFSFATPEQMDKGFRILREAIEEEIQESKKTN